MTMHEAVRPRTLVIKPVDFANNADGSVVQIAVVMGGQDEDVWCASFADRQEAETFVLASNQFGQAVIGIKRNGQTGKNGGAAPQGSDEADRGSSGEACEPGSERGSGQALLVPEQPGQEVVPVSGGDKVGE